MPADLKPGQPIPGSSFLRDYCACCQAPIRVRSVSQKNYCKDCEPGLPEGLELTAEQKELWQRPPSFRPSSRANKPKRHHPQYQSE